MLQKDELWGRFSRLAVVLGLLLAGALFFWKMEAIQNYVHAGGATVLRKYEQYKMHRQIVPIQVDKKLTDEPGAWYTQYHFISHGGGGIDGKTQTDSREAWEKSYAEGNRVIDADLTFTEDHQLVLRHSWGDNLEQFDKSMRQSKPILDANGHILYQLETSDTLSYEEFMHKSIFRKYSPMDLADMIRFMTEHPDLYVAVDAHSFSKNVGIEETYRVLVETAEQMGEKAILSRIIVNIYDVAEYQKVMAVYPFANVTMRQHGVHPNNYYELLNFCLDHNIHVVNVSQKFMEDEGIRLLEDHGIHIYTAVVDYISDMQDFKNLGASGAVSNFLREDDWQYIH